MPSNNKEAKILRMACSSSNKISHIGTVALSESALAGRIANVPKMENGFNGGLSAAVDTGAGEE